MTMAPVSSSARKAIWKAAQLSSFAHGGTWDGLRVFLELQGLDPEDNTQKEWMEELDETLRNIVEIKAQAAHPTPPRSASEFGDLPDFFRDKVRHVVLG
jgi:hypothetical protein